MNCEKWIAIVYVLKKKCDCEKRDENKITPQNVKKQANSRRETLKFFAPPKKIGYQYANSLPNIFCPCKKIYPP